MKLRYLILLFGLSLNTAWADFSNTSVELHPFYPFDGPFVIEINGDWPTDCHPGEQQPVIRAYDGNSVLIEFDIVVIHVTCNQTITPYRVLVDMSDVVGTVAGNFSNLAITVRFDGAEFNETVMLDCGPVVPCQMPPAEDVKPEQGAFNHQGLEDQSLILARQNQWLAAYPLIYDETGGSEWLFAGGEIIQDVYFADLHKLTGGQCLGCPPPPQPPQLAVVGKLTLLMDSAGIVQAKVNDGPFNEFQRLVFGYNTFQLNLAGGRPLVDLAGRWGISENRGTNPPLGDLTEFLPGAFDLVPEDSVPADPEIPPIVLVSYRVNSLTGEALGQLLCQGETGFDGSTQVCEFIDPADASEPLFLFYQNGPSSISIEYARAVIAVGIPPGGKAVRLD